MNTHPVSDNPDNGLTLKADGYYARYYRGGKQLFYKLHTDDTSTARAARDKFYATMKPKEHRKKGRRKAAPPGLVEGGLPPGVSYRKPWHLQIGGRSLGYFHTKKDVEAAYARAVNAGYLAPPPILMPDLGMDFLSSRSACCGSSEPISTSESK